MINVIKSLLLLDYRYGSGSSYNGPRIAGKEIFKNTGANLVANFASGMPYSRQQRITGAALITNPVPNFRRRTFRI